MDDTCLFLRCDSGSFHGGGSIWRSNGTSGNWRLGNPVASRSEFRHNVQKLKQYSEKIPKIDLLLQKNEKHDIHRLLTSFQPIFPGNPLGPEVGDLDEQEAIDEQAEIGGHGIGKMGEAEDFRRAMRTAPPYERAFEIPHPADQDHAEHEDGFVQGGGRGVNVADVAGVEVTPSNVMKAEVFRALGHFEIAGERLVTDLPAELLVAAEFIGQLCRARGARIVRFPW